MLDPYLWIHFSGLAAAPLLLEIVWLSLALGYATAYFLDAVE